MKISEYTLLQDAFDASFGFMLNRIAEAYDLSTDFHANKNAKDFAQKRCFDEFMVALEDIGVELEDVKAPLKVK